MKKEIPQPLVIGSIALVVLAAGFLLWRGIQGPPELPRAPINVGSEPVPDYIKNMSPEMRKMVEEQTRKYGTQPSNATSASSQPPPKR